MIVERTEDGRKIKVSIPYNDDNGNVINWEMIDEKYNEALPQCWAMNWKRYTKRPNEIDRIFLSISKQVFDDLIDMRLPISGWPLSFCGVEWGVVESIMRVANGWLIGWWTAVEKNVAARLLYLKKKLYLCIPFQESFSRLGIRISSSALGLPKTLFLVNGNLELWG